ncbi:MAG: hypothetical protein R2911_33155 [Caldilineaceae bacterium]
MAITPSRFHWDNSWAVGLKGDVNVFKWKALNAQLTLSPKNGLIGTLNISVAGVIDGNGRLHVWKESKKFNTLFGHADMDVQIAEGAIIRQCPLGVCVIVPSPAIKIANASSEFGEFHGTIEDSIWHVKGKVKVYGYESAFFLNTSGELRFDLGGMKQYKLVDQPPLPAQQPFSPLQMQSISSPWKTRPLLLWPWVAMVEI